MGLNLRLPNITGLSEKEQITQIRSYLYQLVTDLQVAFNTSDSSLNNTVVVKQQGGASSPSPTMRASDMFSLLKPLIIKSADIVDAYYERITKKFEGVYVAHSDFGTYKEETAQTIEETSTAIEQVFGNIQTIDTNLVNSVIKMEGSIAETAKSLSDSLSEAESELNESIGGISEKLGGQIEALTKSVNALLTVNAYIKSGLLYYNDEELPVYGLEVGQTNTVNGEETFKKFARFTADRLSFYDQNDREVAYISDYKLYITSVEILYNLIGGGFILDFSKGFTLKFAGGE